MTHIPEDEINGVVRDALREYHTEAVVEGDGGVRVRGNRYADVLVRDRRGSRLPIAVEVENSVTTSDYRDGVAQAEHYRRAGYVPVLALPLVREDLTDPDSRTGEVLNVAADLDLGLLGVWFEEDRDEEGYTVEGAGYVLRPWNR